MLTRENLKICEVLMKITRKITFMCCDRQKQCDSGNMIQQESLPTVYTRAIQITTSLHQRRHQTVSHPCLLVFWLRQGWILPPSSAIDRSACSLQRTAARETEISGLERRPPPKFAEAGKNYLDQVLSGTSWGMSCSWEISWTLAGRSCHPLGRSKIVPASWQVNLSGTP